MKEDGGKNTIKIARLKYAGHNELNSSPLRVIGGDIKYDAPRFKPFAV